MELQVNQIANRLDITPAFASSLVKILVDKALVERRWADVATAVEFAETELPHDLAMTDPALYRTLRGAITTFYLRGGGALNLEKLRQLANTVS